MKRLFTLNLPIVLAIIASACGPAPATPTEIAPPPVAPTEPSAEPTPAAAPNPVPEGPVKVIGSFEYSNDIITYYFTQHAVALADMHGFVTRDLEWEFPVEGQTLGYLDLDPETQTGSFFVQLPARPEGEFNDVDNDGEADAGVQIFAVSYWPNLTGGLYSEGDDRSTGWPTYLASVQTDSENKDEVIGGKLVVWSPDADQQFPAGYGPDGLLFTADDPVAPLAPGYSIIDLDQTPFGLIREAEPEVTLYEPKEVAIKDFSALSWTEAYDAMFESVSINWAFNGIAGKEVDWAALNERIRPLVVEAEADNDALEYYRALHAFTLAIPDGHVGLGDGGGLGNEDFASVLGGGFGLTLRELDDGRFIVIFLTPGGPAEAAGVQVGAEVTAWGGEPVGEAVAKVTPYSGPFSKDIDRRYQQVRYLTRRPLGTRLEVTFTNPGGAPQTVTLEAVDETQSFSRSSIYYGEPDTPNTPVEWRLLDSGIGYISINSYFDDLSLIITLFERALKQLSASGAANLIIDLRFNGGGNPLGLAGFLTDEEILLGQQYSFSEQTGQYEAVGVPDKVLPNENQYRFEKIAVLVGPACFSACEQEAYSFSQVPGAIVVGMYPSGGVFADVLRGQYELPENIGLQISTERFLNPDGTLFLEGAGVVPTVKVPITAENVLSNDDVVLLAAEDALLGIDPNDVELPNGLRLGSIASTRRALNDPNGLFLEQLAAETYTAEQLAVMDTTFTYTLDLTSRRQRLLWGWGWCATSQAVLNQNYQSIELAFAVNGEPVESDLFFEEQQSGNGLFCRSYYAVLYNWPGGVTEVQTVVTFTETINDGQSDYAAGSQTFAYTVTAP